VLTRFTGYAKFGKLTTGEEPAGDSGVMTRLVICLNDSIAIATDRVAPSSTGNGRLLAEEFTDDALSTAPPPPAATEVQ